MPLNKHNLAPSSDAESLAGAAPGLINPLILKLECANKLSDEDRERLVKASRQVRTVEADTDLIQQGEEPDHVFLVLEGFAVRYKDLSDGSRQIMALLIPGDFCDLHVAILRRMDHGIRTVNRCKVVEITRSAIADLTANHPAINRAFWWATLVDEATLREWLLNMGRRQADRQMGHFFFEMLLRLQAVRLATTNTYDLPLTQEELGQVLGLSSVHVNRTLQTLREQDLIIWERGKLTIPDPRRLKAFSDFDPTYLHLEQNEDGRPT